MRIRSTPALLAVLASLALLAGCETVKENFHERFDSVPPKVQQFAGDTRQIAHAVVLACQRLGLTLTGPAGLVRIEAASPLQTDPTLGDSRQILLRVELSEAGGGKTDVALLVVESVASASGPTGGGGERALREHSLYDTFFATLQQILQQSPAGAAPPEK